jgi:type IV secretory pathway TraG/TraD family ATPase VirD4
VQLSPSTLILEDDPILRARPEIVTERPTLPFDLDWDEAQRQARERAFYERIRSTPPGYYIGQWANPYRGGELEYLVDRSDRFVGMLMPTRAGKGVSFVFPNALSFTHSLFVNDPKKELCYGSAWWRKYKLGQRIFIVDPFAMDGRNARFNPMAEVRVRTDYEEIDALNLAQAIVDPDGSGFEGESGIWKKRARALLTALILHILYCDRYREKSLRSVVAFLTEPGRPLAEKYNEMLRYEHDPDFARGWVVTGMLTKTHPIVAQTIQEQIDRPEGEAGSVLSETMSYLFPYRTQLFADNTATSDFAIADIMRGPVPATVYYCVTPDNLEIARAYTRLFLNLLIKRNVGPLSFDANARPEKPYRYKLGMILDEFTSSLGRLDIFARELAYIAGYGLKPAIIIQDQQQLSEVYGQYENITSNIHTQIFGAVNNQATAKLLSEMMGMRHVTKRAPGIIGGGKQPHAWVEEAIPLLSASEARKIPNDEAILRMAHMNPIPIKKLKYYKDDSAFAQRVRKADFASDRIPRELQTGFEERRRQELDARISASRRINDLRNLGEIQVHTVEDPNEKRQKERLLGAGGAAGAAPSSPAPTIPGASGTAASPDPSGVKKGSAARSAIDELGDDDVIEDDDE